MFSTPVRDCATSKRNRLHVGVVVFFRINLRSTNNVTNLSYDSHCHSLIQGRRLAESINYRGVFSPYPASEDLKVTGLQAINENNEVCHAIFEI